MAVDQINKNLSFSDPAATLQNLQTITPEDLATLREGTATRAANIEQFIGIRTPEAIAALQGGAQTAQDLTGASTTAAIESLQPFGGTTAFDERAALLGALGPEAQERAIMGIPVTEVGQARNAREQEQLARSAAARGEFGSGATVEGLTQLGAGQVQRGVQERLGALSPLAQTEQGIASTTSGLMESSAQRQAQIAAGLGPQEAAIRLGGVAPIVEARTTAAELAGLQGIARANQQAQLLQQFGQFAQSRSPQAIQPTTNNPFVSQQNPLGLTSGQGL